MSVINVDIRRYEDQRYVAKHTERTGWGLFAEASFAEGETILRLHTHSTIQSTIVKWEDSFGVCYDRGFSMLPDFSLCSNDNHPFWFLNHSCNPNAGYVRWGRVEDDGVVVIAAIRPIQPGEQITADYSTFTACYDGTPDGQGWEMSPCLCGEPNCRGKITGFEGLPLDLQLKYLLVRGPAHGQVIAHMLHELPELEEHLKQEAPDLFTEYQTVLQAQNALSAELQRTIGPSRAPSPSNRAREQQ